MSTFKRCPGCSPFGDSRFCRSGLYGGLWRYTGVWDLSRIVLAVFTSSVLLQVIVYHELGPGLYPRSIVIIDSLLLVCFLGGARLLCRVVLWRVVPSLISTKPGRRVLIIGAGDAGDMIVREMRKSGAYEPVGFIDDDRSKLGRTIHGVKVLGTRADLPRVIAATQCRRSPRGHPERHAGDRSRLRALARRLQGADHDAAEPVGARQRPGARQADPSPGD